MSGTHLPATFPVGSSAGSTKILIVPASQTDRSESYPRIIGSGQRGQYSTRHIDFQKNCGAARRNRPRLRERFPSWKPIAGEDPGKKIAGPVRGDEGVARGWWRERLARPQHRWQCPPADSSGPRQARQEVTSFLSIACHAAQRQCPAYCHACRSPMSLIIMDEWDGSERGHDPERVMGPGPLRVRSRGGASKPFVSRVVPAPVARL